MRRTRELRSPSHRISSVENVHRLQRRRARHGDVLESLSHTFGFIFNAEAGNGRHTATTVRRIAQVLRDAGHFAYEYDSRAGIGAAGARAAEQGCDVLVACGGDGTVSAVAGAALRARVALGVVPTGTLNHFARDMGIRSVGYAEEVLLHARIRNIDIAMLNGRPFVNNSGIGIYPVIVLERDGVRKSGVPRWPAFLWACIKAILKPPILRLRLEADGVRLARVSPFLFVGNNVYRTNGLAVGTRARLDEGVLGVCTARHHGRAGILRLALRSITGSIRQDRDFTFLTCRNLVVHTAARELRVSLDGELEQMVPPLCYEILPGALQVIAP